MKNGRLISLWRIPGPLQKRRNGTSFTALSKLTAWIIYRRERSTKSCIRWRRIIRSSTTTSGGWNRTWGTGNAGLAGFISATETQELEQAATKSVARRICATSPKRNLERPPSATSSQSSTTNLEPNSQ
jgi:hypothetical protein